MTDKAYAKEVDRKMKAGIPLTNKLDKKAYESGKAASGGTSTTSSGGGGSKAVSSGGGGSTSKGGSGGGSSTNLKYNMTPEQYAAEVDRKRAAGQPLTQAFDEPYYQMGKATSGVVGATQLSPGQIPTYYPEQPPYYPQPQQPQYTPEQLANMIGEQFKELIYPYQQKLEELYQSRPQYTPRSWDELLKQAQSYANLQFDPQVSALSRGLEERRQAAESARQAIEASYASVPERTGRLMEEAGKQALESAIARGAGRSGAVEWLTRELQTPIAERQQQLEAERVAKLADIAEQLNLAEKQAAERQQELATLRGSTAEQQAKVLEELEYARSTGDWERAFQAAQQLSNLATQAMTQANALALDWAPYIMPTWVQEEATRGDLATTLGRVPNIPTTGVGAQPVPVRQYITERYGPEFIDYDPVTDEVIIGGRRIPASSLERKDNRVYAPPSRIEQILRGGY